MNRFASVAFLFACLVLPLMITGESFWIDEGSTVLFARQPDIASWWSYLRENTSSDAQMPLSMLFAWLWDKLIGSSEWQLRSLNIIYGVAALLGIWEIGRRFGMPWLPLLFAIQPFLWFYTNEARAYGLQIAIGSWLLVGFAEFVQTEGKGTRWAWILGISGTFLCYATMLAPLTLVPLAVVGLRLALLRGWRLEKRAVLIFGISALAAIPTALHYVATLKLGAKGAQVWPADFRMLGYIIYELTGFAGLGPAVADLREIIRNGDGRRLISDYSLQLVSLCMFGIAFLGALFRGLQNLRRRLATAILWASFSVLLGTVGLFLAASSVAHKPFWSRHLAPVFPFYVFCFGSVVAYGGRRVRPWLAVVCAFLVFSSLSFRFAARHRKEDYRFSAQIAKAALSAGETVWWIAGPEAGEAYGVPLAYMSYEPGRAFSSQKKTSIGMESASGLRELPLPDLIVMSKPDIFDHAGIAQGIIREHGFKPSNGVQGFRFFRREPASDRVH